MNKEELIAKSDFVITLGTMLADNKEPIRNKIIESIAKTNAQFIYMHPIDNFDVELYYSQFIKYEVGSEEGVLAMLMATFLKDAPEDIRTYIDELDLGYISAESSVGEEELEEVYANSKKEKHKILIIGDDIIEHKRVDNILKILLIIKKYTDLNVVILNDELEEKLNLQTEDSSLEEIEELRSYNGTLVYKLIEATNSDKLEISPSFANIAKVSDKDEVCIKTSNENIRKTIKIDDKLKGTIGILRLGKDDEILCGYRYKQVKIERYV